MNLNRFRRRPQFGLRAIFALITLCAICAANYHVQARRAEEEQQAIHALSKDGARVFSVARRHFPHWCRYVLGPSFHNAGYHIVLPANRLDDQAARRLEQISHRVSISIRGPSSVPESESKHLEAAERYPALRAALIDGYRINAIR